MVSAWRNPEARVSSPAVNAATDHSILYLQPGAYTGLPKPFTITKPLTLAGPGNATITP